MAKFRRIVQIPALVLMVSLIVPSDCKWKPSRFNEIRNKTALQCLMPPTCSLPCVGAPTPRVCPAVVPNCKHGCACHTHCESGVPVLQECFQTKHCTRSSLRTQSTLHTTHTAKTEPNLNQFRRHTLPPGGHAEKGIPRNDEWGQLNLRHARISIVRPRAQILHDEVRKTWAKRRVTRPNNDLESPQTNVGNNTRSKFCVYEPLLSGDLKLKSRVHNGHRGWVRKRSYIKNNLKNKGAAMHNFARTEVATTRCSSCQKYLQNVFGEKVKVPSNNNITKSQKNYSSTARNKFVKLTLFPNDFEIHPDDYERQLSSKTENKDKINYLLATSDGFQEGQLHHFNLGRKKQSFNSPGGRRYLGGMLSQHRVATESKQKTDAKLMHSSKQYQKISPELIALQSQGDWITWKNVRSHLSSKSTWPTKNNMRDLTKQTLRPNNKFVQEGTSDNELSRSIRLHNPGNKVGFKNNAYTSEFVMPMQDYDRRTPITRYDDTEIRLQSHANPTWKIEGKTSNAVMESQNNRPIISGLLRLPLDVISDSKPRIQIKEYAPITPAKQRYRTGTANDYPWSSKHVETSRQPPKNKVISQKTPQPAENFPGDNASANGVAAFLSK